MDFSTDSGTKIGHFPARNDIAMNLFEPMDRHHGDVIFLLG